MLSERSSVVTVVGSNTAWRRSMVLTGPRTITRSRSSGLKEGGFRQTIELRLDGEKRELTRPRVMRPVCHGHAARRQTSGFRLGSERGTKPSNRHAMVAAEIRNACRREIFIAILRVNQTCTSMM